MNIDLHMHSSFSDGSDSADELIHNLRERGISIFSVTDHDTVNGCIEVEKVLPDDIFFIRGVEFSCITRVGKCHILGYDYRFGQSDFNSAIEEGKQLRMKKLKKRLAYLKDVHNIDFNDDELKYLDSLSNVGKPHLAKFIVNRGIASDVGEAIREYINGCKTGTDRVDARTAINAVKAANGIPVWAHPLGGEGEKHLTKDEFQKQLKTLLTCGIKGMECYYSRYSMQEIEFLKRTAKNYNLLISGGSDYHGANKNIPLAKLNADDIPVSREELTIVDEIRKTQSEPVGSNTTDKIQALHM